MESQNGDPKEEQAVAADKGTANAGKMVLDGALLAVILATAVSWLVSLFPEVAFGAAVSWSIPLGFALWSLIVPKVGKEVKPQDVRSWFASPDPEEKQWKIESKCQAEPTKEMPSDVDVTDLVCFTTKEQAKWESEREFIETHVHTRFNFLLVFVGLVLAGAPQIKSSWMVYALCLAGGFLVRVAGLTVERLHARLEVILAVIHLMPAHAGRQNSFLIKKLAQLGHHPSIRMVHIIGIWLPRVLAATCFLAAPMFALNAANSEKEDEAQSLKSEIQSKRLVQAMSLYIADGTRATLLEESLKARDKELRNANGQLDDLKQKVGKLPPKVQEKYGLKP